ncbi:MAG: carboxy terminal-processing peptidase [Pirellulales bacterium]|nr:carboxy terminal-processing peptidase [Pirellulales bacterium]
MFRLFSPADFAARRRTFTSLALLVALSATGLSSLVMARPTAPEAKEAIKQKNISIFVSSLMNRRHMAQLRVDDEISRRAMEMFLKTLDPMKLYFYQSDVDQFANEKTNIDDYIIKGDVSLAKRIFDVFLERVNERTAVAQKFVDATHDYTLDETMDRDPEKINWMASVEEADERWRKRVKYDLLLQSTDDETPEDQAVERLHKRYRSIAQRWDQTSNDELLEMFLTSVTMSFDPHSSYMSPENLENFIIQMRLELDGIGASLESKYGETVVRHIVPGGAADKDGRLKVDDVITGVAQGSDGEVLDITDMKLNDVVMKIRGKPGTVVRLEVKSDGGLKEYDITRARIELKDSEARSAVLERGPHGEVVGEEAVKLAGEPDANLQEPTANVIEQQNADGSVFRIGVVDLPSFYMDMEGRRNGREDYKSAVRDVRKLLEELKEKKVDLVIMDLRFNGGGSLPESVEMTGLFIDQGPVVQVKGPDGRVIPHNDDKPGAVWQGPLVVMINKFSASASEIFAGAIQDYGRGIVVGDKSTHGKGTVQELEELGRIVAQLNPPNYGALKMTIQQFYRPGGDSTQNRGVVSDIELPSQTSHWEVGESDLDYALKFDSVLPLPHENYRNAGAPVIEELRRRSEARVAKSEHFEREKKRIARYLERKEDPITLNKEKFLAERAELNTEKEQEELFDDLQTNDKPVFPRTPYNDEVVAIALDYLELLGDSRLAQR